MISKIRVTLGAGQPNTPEVRRYLRRVEAILNERIDVQRLQRDVAFIAAVGGVVPAAESYIRPEKRRR